jgi:SWI/SNF-related matrix-associated actin-dependent regulator of chromatin subfamily A3
LMSTEAIGRKKPGKRNKKSCSALGPVRQSTKVKELLNDLVQFSKANPHSVNYDPTSLEVQMVDDQGNIIIDDSVKTVVLYDHTALFAALDRILMVFFS